MLRVERHGEISGALKKSILGVKRFAAEMHYTYETSRTQPAGQRRLIGPMTLGGPAHRRLVAHTPGRDISEDYVCPANRGVGLGKS
jgi:hypothetical protein